MIDQKDRQLQDWVDTVIEGATVFFSAPGVEKNRGVGLYLIDLAPVPPARGARKPPLRISLRYLITAWDDDPLEAHRLLGQLAFAAMDNPEFEVEMQPIPIAVWEAFAIAPRPAFVITVPLLQERLQPVVPKVREPVVLKSSLMTSLHGLVLGPEDVPLMGARVEITSLNLSTITDSNGRFQFPVIPVEPPVKFVTVKAKGRELNVTIEQSATDAGPLLIRLQGLEV